MKDILIKTLKQNNLTLIDCKYENSFVWRSYIITFKNEDGRLFEWDGEYHINMQDYSKEKMYDNFLSMIVLISK